MNSIPPIEIVLIDNAVPVTIHKAAPVPVHWLALIKEELDNDVSLVVIQPVPPNPPGVLGWGLSPRRMGTLGRSEI